MTSFLQRSSVLILLLLAGVGAFPVAAQESQTLSVSPTLFEMQASPGQTWQSEIRVINVNEYDLTVYPEAVNFAPLGEDGRGDLIPILEEETRGQSLAEWVQMSDEAVVVPRQQTVTIPITITVPPDAAPGGHYAAILIGTKQPKDEDQVSQVQTAQFVTSLLFVRVAGDVVESADIRELTASAAIVQKPEISLDMRFENEGNVHVQPQGDIKIYNMWGEERGIIPINHQTHFGNVLPASIRKFSFAWKGDTSFFDIGRYRAVATLGYGTETKQFVTATTYFWVVPYVTLFIIIASLFIIGKLSLWFVRRYIERMLLLSGVPLEQQRPYVPLHERGDQANKTVVISRYQSLSAPVRAGMADMVASWRSTTVLKERVLALLKVLIAYRLFLLACATVVIVIVLIVTYITRNTAPSAGYEVSYTSAGTTTTLTAEEIAYNQLRLTATTPPQKDPNQPKLRIENISGRTGIAAKTRFDLEQAGYVVETMTADTSRNETKSVIIYPVMWQEFALELSREMNGVLPSATTAENVDEIVILVGSDRMSN